MDDVFLFRKGQKRYLYRAIDEDGVVIDILLREHRDTASAQALFRQALERTGVMPNEVVTDHHQPYGKAVATTCPGALHVRTGLHRARGETTKAVERSHVPTRDRLRNRRGVKRTETAQRFLEGFEALPCATRWNAWSRPSGAWPSTSRARSAGRGCDPYPWAWPAPAALSTRSR